MYAAHYLLNTERPVSERHFTNPDNWWRLKHWESIGQAIVPDEWFVSDIRHMSDESIVALRDVPRQLPLGIISILREPDVVMRVLESILDEEERQHYLRVIQALYGQAQGMLTDSRL